MKWSHSVLSVVFLLFLTQLSASADYRVERGVIADGGGRLTDPTHVLTGTAGQTVIGKIGDPLHIHGIGFWYQAPTLASPLSEETTLPPRFSLDPPFPCPGGPVTTLRFSLPRSAPVALRLVDVTGRQVCTLLEAVLPAGHHAIRLDGARLTSGVYFCEM